MCPRRSTSGTVANQSNRSTSLAEAGSVTGGSGRSIRGSMSENRSFADTLAADVHLSQRNYRDLPVQQPDRAAVSLRASTTQVMTSGSAP